MNNEITKKCTSTWNHAAVLVFLDREWALSGLNGRMSLLRRWWVQTSRCFWRIKHTGTNTVYRKLQRARNVRVSEFQQRCLKVQIPPLSTPIRCAICSALNGVLDLRRSCANRSAYDERYRETPVLKHALAAVGCHELIILQSAE